MADERSPEEVWDRAPGPDENGLKHITDWVELKFDRQGNLYAFGKRLKVAQRVDLNHWQTILATLTALGIFLGGLAALIEAIG